MTGLPTTWGRASSHSATMILAVLWEAPFIWEGGFATALRFFLVPLSSTTLSPPSLPARCLCRRLKRDRALAHHCDRSIKLFRCQTAPRHLTEAIPASGLTRVLCQIRPHFVPAPSV